MDKNTFYIIELQEFDMRQQNQELTHVKHEFDPIFDENSEILILGTLPSVKSREQNFYYGHPQNRFWKVIAALFCEPVPERIPEKKDLLLKHHIALWDVIAECDIAGSSDSSIKNVVPAELSVILDHAPIRTIYANGAKAYDLYPYITFATDLTMLAVSKVSCSPSFNKLAGSISVPFSTISSPSL